MQVLTKEDAQLLLRSKELSKNHVAMGYEKTETFKQRMDRKYNVISDGYYMLFIAACMIAMMAGLLNASLSAFLVGIITLPLLLIYASKGKILLFVIVAAITVVCMRYALLTTIL